MIPIQIIVDFFAGGLLLATFLMIGKVRLIPMLRYFVIASLCLAGLGASMSVLHGRGEFIASFATVLFKVIVVPLVIFFTAKELPNANELKMYVRPATTYILFALVMVISATIVRNIPLTFPGVSEIAGIPENAFFFKSLLFISVSLILSGILFAVVRKDLFSQVLGLLTMENGIAAFGLVTIHGIPLLLEMGIFFVIITSTIILATLIDSVHKVHDWPDTSSLTELTD